MTESEIAGLNVRAQAKTERTPKTESSSDELSEIKDARLIFDKTWNKLESEIGRENMQLPKEFIFLMGAPASGKGVQTPAILKARGITNPPIVISALLANNESFKGTINSGGLVSDGRVLEELVRAMLNSEKVGVLVDGFPRNTVQAEMLKLLHTKMRELRKEFRNTDLGIKFPRPVFRICVLYVDEEVSIQRQLARGRQAIAHNAMVREVQTGMMQQERSTDMDEEIIRSRYRIFKEHYGTLLSLSKMFPFHLINAVGTMEQVTKTILDELAYQSSLELEHNTYDVISAIPLASSIGQHARQDLIARLESYQAAHKEAFAQAVDFVLQVIMPVVNQHAVSGTAVVRTEDARLDQPLLKDMVMDVLSERGFLATFDERVHYKPTKVDLETGDLQVEAHKWTIIRVTFPKHHIRQ